jgi:hypothetical protein
MAFSCSAIIVGAFGAGCLCKPCANSIALPVIYGIFLFFIWIIILIVGLVVTGISVTSPSTLQSFCEGSGGNARLSFISDQISTIDVQISSYASTYMCSAICPCASTNQSSW